MIAASAAAVLLLAAGTAAQLGVLVAAAVAGALACRSVAAADARTAVALPGTVAWAALALFLLLLLGLPLLSWHFPHGLLALAHVFYRSGALVFGGGHVVLPLLRESLVPQGVLSDDGFLAGYGFAQAMPGPLFSVAAYLGAAATHGSPRGAAVALVAIFLPGLLLAVAGVSLSGRLARHARAGAALAGVNAAVVGILAAALYNPVWVSAVRDGADVAVAAVGLVLLQAMRAAPLLVVVLCVAYSVLRTLH
jgi:chromate transporter